MTIIYITEYNCKRYGVTYQNNEHIKVQQYEDISEDKNVIYEINPMEIFFGKSKKCTMTALSGSFKKKSHIGNTILVKANEENGKNRYVYIGGDMICSFLTTDRIYEYISNMSNNLSPYSLATGEKNYYLLAPYFSYIKKDKIDYDTILDGIYVPDSELKESFEKIELNVIHSNYDNDDDN